MKKEQKLILTISILAAFVAFLDGSVVNVALPAIVRELGGGLQVQQWVVDSYLLTLGSLILLAGSLSDLFGRQKVLAVGLIGFGLASILCAIAPKSSILITARAMQGIAGALLVPSSLALIIANFKGAAQAKAIGTWTAWTGISFLIGPLVGGILVDKASWRWVFAINVIPIAITLFLIRRIKGREKLMNKPKLDIVGALLCTFGLAGPVYALIEQPHYSWSNPIIYTPLTLGLVLLLGFIIYEGKYPKPMLPLLLFKVRNFSVGNIATTIIYAGLAVATFLLIIFLQQVGHYSALNSGLSLLPVTIIMFLLSPKFGGLAGRFGPRLFMGLGPIIGGLGFLMMLRIGTNVAYLTQILPGILVFGLGLSMTVAPLTAAILGGIESQHAGIGSAVNNAIARIAGLLATAAIGVVIGSQLTLGSFKRGMVATALLLIFGGVISAIGIQNTKPEPQPIAGS